MKWIKNWVRRWIMKWVIVCRYSDTPQAWWVRICNIVIHFKRDDARPLFSERNGYHVYRKIPFTRWRVRIFKDELST